MNPVAPSKIRLFLLAGILALGWFVALPYHAIAQPLSIGARVQKVDSTLRNWTVVPSAVDPGDSVCLGAKFWDIEGHLQFHIDTNERKLTKVDWSAYLPVPRPQVDGIAKDLCVNLGEASRARNDQWIYWIWDNDEIHYLLGYAKGTLRLLEFEDQTALEACVLPH